MGTRLTMQNAEPALPINSKGLRPYESTRNTSAMTDATNLTTPKIPVERILAELPVTPIDLKIVGE